MERDIIPMCRNNGMSIGKLETTGSAAAQMQVRTCLIVSAPYAVLGQGKFKTPEELKAKGTRGGGAPPTEEQIQLCKVLQEVAEEIGGGIKLANGAWRPVTSIQYNPFAVPFSGVLRFRWTSIPFL